MGKSIFITGATGYIGGATLAHLLSSEDSKTSSYAALVRDKRKASLLASPGVRPVIGTLNDAAILSEESSKAEVVIHTADSSDHVASCKAILEGMKKRNDHPVLIHISGTGVLIDDARGEYAMNDVYSDLDLDDLNKKIPDTALHRNVELMVLSASPEVKTHIVSPSTIYGIADHPLVRKGISNPISMQIPNLIHASIDRRQAGMVGKGLNVWPNVHITEVATVIETVLKKALLEETTTECNGYYFAASGEYKFYDVASEMGRVLHDKGIGKPEPTTFSEEEIKKYFEGSYYLGSNARCRADHLHQLGWKSTHTTADLLKSIGPEVDYILKKNPGKS